MNQRTKKWRHRGLAVGLLVALIPCSTTWAAHKEIPTKEYRVRLIDCHRLGVEASLGICYNSFGTFAKFTSNWGFGGFYGYAWAQKASAWFIPEVGLKYKSRQGTISRYPKDIIVREPSIYIPLSVNLVSITPEWKMDDELFSKWTLGLGYEIVVALSSTSSQEGQAARNLLTDIPSLSRFSGNILAYLRITTCWGIYTSLMSKIPLGLLTLLFSNMGQGQDVKERDVRSFRVGSTSSVEFSLGLDVIQWLEE